LSEQPATGGVGIGVVVVTTKSKVFAAQVLATVQHIITIVMSSIFCSFYCIWVTKLTDYKMNCIFFN